MYRTYLPENICFNIGSGFCLNLLILQQQFYVKNSYKEVWKWNVDINKCIYIYICKCCNPIVRTSFYDCSLTVSDSTLQQRHNGRDSVSNHQAHDCLLDRLSRRRSKKTSKDRVTGLCAGNSLGTGEFPAQMASNAKMFPFDDVIMT